MRSLGGAVAVYLLTCVFGRAAFGLVVLAAADVAVARLVLCEIGAHLRAPLSAPPRAAAPPAQIARAAEPS